jgi:hypothetical protein
MSLRVKKEHLSLKVFGHGLSTTKPPKQIKPSFRKRVSAMRIRLSELRRNAQIVEQWLNEVENIIN